MTDDLIFEEPPNAGRGPGGGNLSPIAVWLDSLRQHPNQWAKYTERVHASTITAIKSGTRYGSTEGEFEAVGRDHKSDPQYRAVMFARYIGGES